MRVTLYFLMAAGLCLATLATADVTTRPATRPAVVNRRPATRPVAVPYRLMETNHLMVRLKINGRGPYNFIVDTGAPAMLLDEAVGRDLGLKPNAQRAAAIDRLEIEGGLELDHVQCRVMTPYQLTGMNAMGVMGAPIHGLLGYPILSRFRIEFDLARDHMIWTPLPARAALFNPARGLLRRPATTTATTVADQREQTLESMGGLMKAIGPLVRRPDRGTPRGRGFIGLELADHAGTVSVAQVLGDSPAERAGVHAGDVLASVDAKPVRSLADAHRATAGVLPGQVVRLGLRSTTQPSATDVSVTCGEGL